MKKINNFLFKSLLLFLFFCILGVSMVNTNIKFFSRYDMKIELTAEWAEENLIIQMELTNICSEPVRIPKFFFPSDQKEFFSDWFEIIDSNDNVIDYEGNIADIEYDQDKVECIVLKPKEKYLIKLNYLLNYYSLKKDEKYTIQYYGPLGSSNIFDLKSEK